MKTNCHSLFLFLIIIFYSCQTTDSLKLDPVSIMLDSGEKTTLSAFCEKTGEKINVYWKSANPDIASVDGNGKVIAISQGETSITATDPKTGVTATVMVSVEVQSQNPLLPPSWELYIADPEPKVFEDGVYVYGSMDVDGGVLPSGTSWCSDQYHVLYSKDMVNWTDRGIAFHLNWIPDEFKNPSYKRLWAPDVLKHPSNGKYYLFSCFNHISPVREEVIMVSVSDKPEGPFSNSKPLLIDGKYPIIAIDPAVLVDDDGKAYVTWPFEMGQLDPNDFTKVLSNTIVDVKQWMPVENTPFEGPSLRKRGDTYYYIYIENEGLRNRPDGTQYNKPTRMVYMTSKNPLGPYKYRGLIIATSGYPNVINIHGSFVEFKDEWYLFYHLPVIDKKLTRAMCIERMHFQPDGTIYLVEPSSSGIIGTFAFGDKIQASSAVIYPGGELNPHFISRRGDYAKLVFKDNGSYAGFKYIDLAGIKSGSITLNVNSQGEGGIFEVRKDGLSGPVLARFDLSDTKGKWQEISQRIQDMGNNGKSSFYIVLKNKPKNGLVELDWIKFN